MTAAIASIKSWFLKLYRFLPIQLLLLHFRKYQLLLVFWLILVSTVTGHFAKTFGASTLFLEPEYQGKINFVSMLLLGAAMAAFVMSWHISTFIIHSKRIPFLGAARQAFLKYCINNSILPLAFLMFYTIVSVRYQFLEGDASPLALFLRQLGFYLGFLLSLILSFAYFFRVDRDLLKSVIGAITNPALLRELIPYDSLDLEYDMVRADTYLTETGGVEHISTLERYPHRLLNTILRRHHRNAIFATLVSVLLLMLMGIFMAHPIMRIPAGAGFLLLFSVMISLVAAIKYFLKSWEMIGWVLLFTTAALLVKWKVIDLRSVAYGINYSKEENVRPVYDYESLKTIFTEERYQRDKATGLARLQAWEATKGLNIPPPLVVISVSGGGSRSAYWTFRCLQYADSISGGKLYKNCVLLTGASGGMIGASYWRSIHHAAKAGQIREVYNSKYQENVGKDLLNAIVFSMVSVDFISVFNNIKIGNYTYSKDRAYAMEEELIRNTEGMLGYKLGDFTPIEAAGITPALIVNATIVNDGRRLIMGAQPASYLCQPANTLRSPHAPIDAVDFATFFAKQDPYKLRIATALRMNATFPYVLPVAKLPSLPEMNVMDAGLRDNFGTEVVSRFLYVFREWIQAHTRKVIWLEIRDTRDYEVYPSSQQDDLGEMITAPATVIQNKWQPFQSYYQGYMKDLTGSFLGDKFHFVSLQYTPEVGKKTAALNFHLTENEKSSIYNAVYVQSNQSAMDSLALLLK